MLGEKRNKEYVKFEVVKQIAKYLLSLKTKAKNRECLYCGKLFKLFRSNRYYCSSRCGRTAHYLSFQIRNIGD